MWLKRKRRLRRKKLEGMVLDFQETPQGASFTISKFYLPLGS